MRGEPADAVGRGWIVPAIRSRPVAAGLDPNDGWAVATALEVATALIVDGFVSFPAGSGQVPLARLLNWSENSRDSAGMATRSPDWPKATVGGCSIEVPL